MPILKQCLRPKKKNLDSFQYKGSTYVKSTGKNGIIIYKKK